MNQMEPGVIQWTQKFDGNIAHVVSNTFTYVSKIEFIDKIFQLHHAMSMVTFLPIILVNKVKQKLEKNAKSGH